MSVKFFALIQGAHWSISGEFTKTSLRLWSGYHDTVSITLTVPRPKGRLVSVVLKHVHPIVPPQLEATNFRNPPMPHQPGYKQTTF